MARRSPARSSLRLATAVAVAVLAVHGATASTGMPASAATRASTPTSSALTSSTRTTAGDERRSSAAVVLAANGDGGGRSPSVSGDGRFVVSLARATDQRDETVLLDDRQLDVSIELLPMPDDLVPGESAWPVISADGCTVTVLTELALDRYRDGERGGRWDVYQRRLDECGGSDEWQLVSGGSGTGLSAEAANDADPRSAPAVSDDGTVVVYAERIDAESTTVLVIVDTTQQVGSTLRRREISAGTGVQMLDPTIDGTGHLLAATVASGDGTTSRVMIWNLDDSTGTAPATVPGSGRAWQPAMSGDGTVLAFVSDAADVVSRATMGACLPECVPQVYVYDLDDGSTTLVSRTPRSSADEPIAGNGASSQPVLGRSGDEVLFITRATNFFSTRHRVLGAADDGELVRVAVASGTMWREHHADDGIAPAPRVDARPAMSANGRVVATDAASAGGRVLHVSVVEPQLEAADLDVGTTGLGFTSVVTSVTIINHGPSVFVPAFAAADVLDFGVVGGSCLQVDRVVVPGTSCTVDVAFAPGADGPQSATLRVGEDGLGGAMVSVSLHGAGGDPLLVATPAALDLKALVIGDAMWPTTVMIQNTTQARVRVATVLLGGEGAGEFEITNDECSGKALRANKSCRVDVRFAPRTEGTHAATLRATAGTGEYTTVALRGVARLAPAIRLVRGGLTRPDDVAAVMVGTRVVVQGQGFGPSEDVVVVWADGTGRVLHATTDGAGRFRVRVVVLPGERLGFRTLVALAADHAAALRVRVVNAPPR